MDSFISYDSSFYLNKSGLDELFPNNSFQFELSNEFQTSSPNTPYEQPSYSSGNYFESAEKKKPKRKGKKGEEKSFECSYEGCNKTFKRSEHLKRHIRSIHTLEKPYKCNFPDCGKKFARSDNLAQHARIHRNRNKINRNWYLPYYNQNVPNMNLMFK